MSATMEQEVSHTPGPWVIWDGHTSVHAGPVKENTRSCLRGGRGTICEMDELLCDCGEDYDLIHDDNGGVCPALLANARLIAAAPDLLTALQMAIPALEWCDQQWAKSPQRGEGVNVLAFVRAAIAKATEE
jgi:hypothetical protein